MQAIGIEVGGIDIATDARRLERNRSATAERVRHLRPMTEPRDAQLLHQLGHELCCRAEMAFTSAQIGSEQLCLDRIPRAGGRASSRSSKV